MDSSTSFLSLWNLDVGAELRGGKDNELSFEYGLSVDFLTAPWQGINYVS